MSSLLKTKNIIEIPNGSKRFNGITSYLRCIVIDGKKYDVHITRTFDGELKIDTKKLKWRLSLKKKNNCSCFGFGTILNKSFNTLKLYYHIRISESNPGYDHQKWGVYPSLERDINIQYTINSGSIINLSTITIPPHPEFPQQLPQYTFNDVDIMSK